MQHAAAQRVLVLRTLCHALRKLCCHVWLGPEGLPGGEEPFGVEGGDWAQLELSPHVAVSHVAVSHAGASQQRGGELPASQGQRMASGTAAPEATEPGVGSSGVQEAGQGQQGKQAPGDPDQPACTGAGGPSGAVSAGSGGIPAAQGPGGVGGTGGVTAAAAAAKAEPPLSLGACEAGSGKLALLGELLPVLRAKGLRVLLLAHSLKVGFGGCTRWAWGVHTV